MQWYDTYESGYGFNKNKLVEGMTAQQPTFKTKSQTHDSLEVESLMPLIEVMGWNPGVIAFFEITMSGYFLSRLMSSYDEK